MHKRIARSVLGLLVVCLALAACIMPDPASQSTGASQEPRDAALALSKGEVAKPRTVESQPIEGRLPFSQRGWQTDFTKRTIDYNEIRSGGPPKDGIPALDSPTFESITDAGDWLTDTDPVIVLEIVGQTRAYPLSILIWHEIVNDKLAGRPVTVTFCPLCNASIVFDRRVGDMILDFGTTGNLRNSDLVMYDRQTESWWQQFTGQAIMGELASTQLNFLSSQVLPFAEFRNLFPEGEVLQRPLDLYSRPYGSNPYVLYDTYGNSLSRGQDLLLFSGVQDERLEPLDRVVGVLFADSSSVAIPFAVVRAEGVVHYAAAGTGQDFVVFHQYGMSSALDGSRIGDGRDIGSIGVFANVLDGQQLDFTVATAAGVYMDIQTGSTWNIRGQAIAGELEGKALEPLVAFDHFWFAWAAFLPDTHLYSIPRD